MGLARHIGKDRHLRSRKGDAVKHRRQFLPCGPHEFRVERSGGGERQRAFDAQLLGDGGRGSDRIFRSGQHLLGGGVYVYQGIGTEYETLLGAFDKDNESFKKRIGIDRAASSYKVRIRSRNHLAAFIKKCYKRSDISMLELTPDFIKEYEIYLSTDAGLHNGSVWSHCMWLKTIVSKAHYNGLTPRNPFAQYRVNQNIKERQYLTEDEIKAVMTHEFADKKLAYIRDLFVFASFTALSFVDIMAKHRRYCGDKR